MKIHGSNSVAAAGARVALKAFGLELRTARVEAGLRQEDAAEELGVSTQTIRNWESGRSEPSEENKQKLAEKYGVEVGDFAVFYEEFHSYRVTRERPVINAKLLRLARQDAGFTQAQAAEMDRRKPQHHSQIRERHFTPVAENSPQVVGNPRQATGLVFRRRIGIVIDGGR